MTATHGDACDRSAVGEEERAGSLAREERYNLNLRLVSCKPAVSFILDPSVPRRLDFFSSEHSRRLPTMASFTTDPGHADTHHDLIQSASRSPSLSAAANGTAGDHHNDSGAADDHDDESSKRKKGAKRRKVNHACLYCRRSHMTCDEGRPCQRWYVGA